MSTGTSTITDDVRSSRRDCPRRRRGGAQLRPGPRGPSRDAADQAPLAAGGNSAWAQGGIAAAMGADDAPRLHAQRHDCSRGRSVRARRRQRPHGRCAGAHPPPASPLAPASTRTASGALALGREAAHRRHRILHAQGDASGGRDGAGPGRRRPRDVRDRGRSRRPSPRTSSIADGRVRRRRLARPPRPPAPCTWRRRWSSPPAASVASSSTPPTRRRPPATVSPWRRAPGARARRRRVRAVPSDRARRRGRPAAAAHRGAARRRRDAGRRARTNASCSGRTPTANWLRATSSRAPSGLTAQRAT